MCFYMIIRWLLASTSPTDNITGTRRTFDEVPAPPTSGRFTTIAGTQVLTDDERSLARASSPLVGM